MAFGELVCSLEHSLNPFITFEYAYVSSDLAGNSITNQDGTYLARMLNDNTTVLHLDVSRNLLGMSALFVCQIISYLFCS